MKKSKDIIQWLGRFLIRRGKLNDRNVEKEPVVSKEVENNYTHIIKCEKDNIKIKGVKENFEKKSEFEIPEWNNEDINYCISNSSLNKYSLNVVNDYNSEIDYYNFREDMKRLELDRLSIFEEIEMNYFEELEEYERQLKGLVKFRYRTFDEIGKEGELRVESELALLDEKEYRIINNILIPSYNEKTTQIDSIVVSKYGIFIIETKKYAGIIVGDEDSKYWTSYNRTIKSNKIIRRKFYNPIRQNLGHILSLKKLLNKVDNLWFHSIVVFDEIADLKIKTVTDVIYIKDLINHIKRYDQQVIDKSVVEELYHEILKYKLADSIYLQEHLEYVTNIKGNNREVKDKNLVKELYHVNNKYKLDDHIFQKEHTEHVINIKKDETTYYDKNIKLEYFLTLCLVPRIGTKTMDYIMTMYKNMDIEINTIDDLLDFINKCHDVNSYITVPIRTNLEIYYQDVLKFIDNYRVQGISLTPYYDPNYPRGLRGKHDYPKIVFTSGDIRVLNNSKRIGILVSQSTTQYGSSSAYRLGEICALKNITVVSIVGEDYDLSAVKGVLDNGGKVILVKPTKLEWTKNNANQKIYDKVLENKGCIISFTNDENLKNNYGILNFNKNFMKLINKLILVEPYLNDNILKNIREIYSSELDLAYVPQSKTNERLGRIDPDYEIMSKWNAIKLSDPETLSRFLS